MKSQYDKLSHIPGSTFCFLSTLTKVSSVKTINITLNYI